MNRILHGLLSVLMIVVCPPLSSAAASEVGTLDTTSTNTQTTTTIPTSSVCLEISMQTNAECIDVPGFIDAAGYTLTASTKILIAI